MRFTLIRLLIWLSDDPKKNKLLVFLPRVHQSLCPIFCFRCSTCTSLSSPSGSPPSWSSSKELCRKRKSRLRWREPRSCRAIRRSANVPIGDTLSSNTFELSPWIRLKNSRIIKLIKTLLFSILFRSGIYYLLKYSSHKWLLKKLKKLQILHVLFKKLLIGST